MNIRQYRKTKKSLDALQELEFSPPVLAVLATASSLLEHAARALEARGGYAYAYTNPRTSVSRPSTVGAELGLGANLPDDDAPTRRFIRVGDLLESHAVKDGASTKKWPAT